MAGARWTRGPRHLATSRLVEVRVSRRRSVKTPARHPQVRQIRRRPARVLVGLLQRSPLWSTVRHVSAKPRDSPPYETQALSRPSSGRRIDLPTVRSLGSGSHAGTFAAWTAGGQRRISDAAIVGHRSPRKRGRDSM
jgi:hypothetical protein